MRDGRFFLKDDRGFSLVELLIAMALTGLVAMAAYTVFSTSNWSYMVQDQVSEAQQNVRVAMDRMTSDIRLAGFGLPDPPFSFDFGGGNAFNAPITFANSSTGADTITILGIGHEAGVLRKGTNTDCNDSDKEYLCICRTSADCPGESDKPDSFFNNASPPEFLTTRRFISLDGIKYIELSSDPAHHTRTTGGSSPVTKMKLSSSFFLDRDYADNTPVYIIQAVQYSIQTDANGDPFLASRDFTQLRGPGDQTLAENIEDIQFAYCLKGSPSFVNWASLSSTEMVAIRANVIGRTRKPDPKGASGFSRPGMEDRGAGGIDGYRRRVLTNVIKIRNPRASS